jgi:hypothetical protein
VNTTSQRAATRKEIQAGMEAAILKGCKAKVEITMMGENTWSICGTPSQAIKAMEYLEKSGLAKEINERSSFAGEAFIYFKTGAAS